MEAIGNTTLEPVGITHKPLEDYRRIVGGIPLHIQDGVGGFLVDSVEECAERVLFLLTHSEEAEEIARRGWERVKDRFLMTNLLKEELKLLRSVLDRN